MSVHPKQKRIENAVSDLLSDRSIPSQTVLDILVEIKDDLETRIEILEEEVDRQS